MVGLRPGEKLFEELLNDASKTLPTHHDKIMIAQEYNVTDFDSFKSQLENLIQYAKKMQSDAVVAEMKKIVPEFKSRNSVYENLD